MLSKSKLFKLSWLNKSVVHNDILIDVGLIATACGEGADEPAHTHGLVRAFASRICKV